MIQRFTGLLLDVDDAAYLAGALTGYCEILREDGKQPRPRLEALRTKLTSVITDVSASNVKSCGAHGEDPGHDAGYATVTTAEAARILGTTPGNVRDLARRGRLRAQRPRGRWLYDTAAVELLAERMER